jgi:hypothetical protein
MTQHYRDESRASDPYSLPDLETFYLGDADAFEDSERAAFGTDDEPLPVGWYYWACFPGCLPDGEPVGPFETEADALADARDGFSD